jgi:hypothetical protein
MDPELSCPEYTPSRREVLESLVAWSALGLTAQKQGTPEASGYQLTTFTAEVTPPLGHPLMAGGITPAQKVDDPLFAHGLVLLGAGMPIVLVAVDRCEIRNDAYSRWRAALAEAAGTVSERVLLACVHQHDAPIADLEAERILESHKAGGRICDLEFHERTVRRVAKSLKNSLASPRSISHIGLGQAKVEGVASNRRYLGGDGKPRFNRMSATRDAEIREQPEGTVDPYLKTLSFWDRDRPLAAVSCYASHPMSYYGKGGVSSDFVGLARKRRQADDPSVTQLYFSGCSGNVTAGKFNDGSPENRPILADRLYQGMVGAWKATKRYPIPMLDYRAVPLRLEPRSSVGFTAGDLQRRLVTDGKPFGQCLAALGLSWRKRADAGHKIEVPVLDFGISQLLLLPGESYVEYQLIAQRLRPDSFVIVIGYGECAPGYIPMDKAFEENDSNLNEWCWVSPGSEQAMLKAVKTTLKKASP